MKKIAVGNYKYRGIKVKKILYLIIISIISSILFSCASSKINDETEGTTKEVHEIGKYAGVPPQYRAILQEQEEKNAKQIEEASEEDEADIEVSSEEDIQD